MINANMLAMYEVITDFQSKLDKYGAIAYWYIAEGHLNVKVWFSVNGEHHHLQYAWKESELTENPFLDKQLDQIVIMMARKIEQERLSANQRAGEV